MIFKNIETYLEKLEAFLDRFFAAQAGLFCRLLSFFEYTYRETHSGVFGLFSSPDAIRRGAAKTKEQGYTNFDCLTPFPVHGLEEDMGLGRSRIPYITFFAGITGLVLGIGLQVIVHEQVIGSIVPYLNDFPNLRSYPLNIGGKPTFSWPAMIPICFELTILIGGHTTVAGLILLSGLYRPFRRVLHPDITKDKFCLWIPSDSANYLQDKVITLLKELGASEITLVSPGGKKLVSEITANDATASDATNPD